MNITVHVYLHDDGTGQKLDTLLALVKQLQQGEAHQMAEIDDLIKAVEDEKTVDESAVTLLTALTAKINSIVSSATDLAALKSQITAVTTDVAAHNVELADAITANTPAG